MPRKKKPAPESNGADESPSQMLQHKRDDAPAVQQDNRRSALRMNNFIRKYEELCGNISATCAVTGVSRRTYYRWIQGNAPIHRRFQKKIAKIIPGEKLVDAAEAVLLHHLNNKDLTAAIFTSKTKGKHRGWSEKPDVIVINTEVLDRVAQAYQAFLSDHPELTFEDKWKWLVRFANGAKEPVEPEQLAKKCGINPQGVN